MAPELPFEPVDKETLHKIRAEFNLEDPQRLNEAIDTLHDWVQKQSHFTKKDFSRKHLEVYIMAAKGSIERAKLYLDKICTMRTFFPQFFGTYNIKEDFKELFEKTNIIILPKYTQNNHRIGIMKFKKGPITAANFMDNYKYSIYICEYMIQYDYINQYIVINDLSDVNLKDVITNVNPLNMHYYINIFAKGYGAKIKAIHFITKSKLINSLINMAKSILSKKMMERVQVHTNLESLYKYVPKDLLPLEYGGKEKSAEEINADFIKALSTDDFIKNVEEIVKSGTDESKRQEGGFNEELLGMPGSFKVLNVD